jgi:HD-GYP domain-containing protein (c-di-GMP phosphodiesterase class II)
MMKRKMTMAWRPEFNVIDISGLDTRFDEITKGFLPVRVRSLFPETVLPCDIYCLAHKSDEHGLALTKLLDKGDVFRPAFRRYLMAQELDEAYIHGEEEEVFNEYFNRHTQIALQAGDAPLEKKAELLYDQADYLVKRVFRERPTPANIRLGQQLVAQFFSHVLANRIASQALLSLFSKDYYTFSHCVQVALLGMSLCQFLGWKREEVEDFGLGALFHDVGKNAIDERILNKPGKLDKDEFELVKRHPLLGYEQIKATQVMTRSQLSIVLQHHEGSDGSGYPGGLKEFAIHRYARAARIVDIYDALTTHRPYREALPGHEALRIMNEEMKETLDTTLFRAFTRHVQRETGSEEVTTGPPLNLAAGTPIQVQFEGEEIPLKGVLVGFEGQGTMIIRLPASGQIRDLLEANRMVVGRYVAANVIHMFQTVVLKYERHPFPLLFLSCPQATRTDDLRKRLRTNSYIRAKLYMGREQQAGAVLDLSQEGCRLVVKSSSAGPLQTITVNEGITLAADLSGTGEYQSLTGIIRHAMVGNDKAVLGVQFVELPPVAREAIERLCQESLDR